MILKVAFIILTRTQKKKNRAGTNSHLTFSLLSSLFFSPPTPLPENPLDEKKPLPITTNGIDLVTIVISTGFLVAINYKTYNMIYFI